MRVTNHAEDRVIERLACTREKVLKLAYKAWKSTEDTRLLRYKINSAKPTQNGELPILKAFLGAVWVFQISTDGVPVLVTVMNGKSDIDHQTVYYKVKKGLI